MSLCVPRTHAGSSGFKALTRTVRVLRSIWFGGDMLYKTTYILRGMPLLELLSDRYYDSNGF